MPEAQVFKVFKSVFYNAFIQATQILRTKAKWIRTHEMMKIPADKHPIETIVVTHKNRPVLTIVL